MNGHVTTVRVEPSAYDAAMSESETSPNQANEGFVEPSRDEIPGISRQHVTAMESSDADEIWILAGMHHVVLTTVGRKSGKVHKVALPYWLDSEGRRVVVASFSGAPQHPSWFVNLRDRTANPEVHVRVQGSAFWAEPEILEGDDYQQTWAGLTADRAYYNDYQSRTDRQIPLVRLVELRPA
jgi:deazaflavin-dependent oxidoreductase (nitroreductase family)